MTLHTQQLQPSRLGGDAWDLWDESLVAGGTGNYLPPRSSALASSLLSNNGEESDDFSSFRSGLQSNLIQRFQLQLPTHGWVCMPAL